MLHGHSGSIWSCAFCPDREEVLASGSSDRTVRLVATLPSKSEGGTCMCHRTLLPSSGRNGTARCLVPCSAHCCKLCTFRSPATAAAQPGPRDAARGGAVGLARAAAAGPAGGTLRLGHGGPVNPAFLRRRRRRIDTRKAMLARRTPQPPTAHAAQDLSGRFGTSRPCSADARLRTAAFPLRAAGSETPRPATPTAAGTTRRRRSSPPSPATGACGYGTRAALPAPPAPALAGRSSWSCGATKGAAAAAAAAAGLFVYLYAFVCACARAGARACM